MEKLDKRSEEKTYLWAPFQFIDQTLKAIFKCLGLLRHDSPTTTKTATYPVTLNQSEKEDEDEDVAIKDDVVTTTRGGKNGVVVSSKGTKGKNCVVVSSKSTKVRAKKKKREELAQAVPANIAT